MKRIFYILTLAVLALFLLSACRPNPTVLPASTFTVVTDQPVSATEEPTSYPAPETLPSLPEGQADFLYDSYPGPVKENVSLVDWQTALTTILDGEVAEIYQDGVLHVTLILKSGAMMLTVQPARDEVSKTLDGCGEPCSDTILVTE